MNRILFFLCVMFFLLTDFFLGSAFAAVIDLNVLFDNEGDGIIHFGDEEKALFSDPSVDYGGISDVSVSFDMTEKAVANGFFWLTIRHRDSSSEYGYHNYLTLNGHQFDLEDSSGGWKGHGWYHSTSILNLLPTGNTLTFHVDSNDAGNLDDFEVAFLNLKYDSSPVPAPGTIVLFGCGLICLAGSGRKGSCCIT